MSYRQQMQHARNYPKFVLLQTVLKGRKSMPMVRVNPNFLTLGVVLLHALSIFVLLYVTQNATYPFFFSDGSFSLHLFLMFFSMNSILVHGSPLHTNFQESGLSART